MPLLVYASSIATSLSQPALYSRLGRKKVMALGGLLALTMSGLIVWGPISTLWVVGVLAGASMSLTLNTAINLISEVVGTRDEHGAFVFGAYSFCDKLISGLAIFALSGWFLNRDTPPSSWLFATAPLLPALASTGVVLLLPVKEYLSQQDNEQISDEFVV